MTLEEAKRLEFRQVIYQVGVHDSAGHPKRWRVNGKVRTWVRDPSRVTVPLRYGMYNHGELTEGMLDQFELTEDEAMYPKQAGLMRLRREFIQRINVAAMQYPTSRRFYEDLLDTLRGAAPRWQPDSATSYFNDFLALGAQLNSIDNQLWVRQVLDSIEHAAANKLALAKAIMQWYPA